MNPSFTFITFPSAVTSSLGCTTRLRPFFLLAAPNTTTFVDLIYAARLFFSLGRCWLHRWIRQTRSSSMDADEPEQRKTHLLLHCTYTLMCTRSIFWRQKINFMHVVRVDRCWKLLYSNPALLKVFLRYLIQLLFNCCLILLPPYIFQWLFLRLTLHAASIPKLIHRLLFLLAVL